MTSRNKGEVVMYFCDTLYKGLGNTAILVWQMGGGLILVQNCVTSFMNAPLAIWRDRSCFRKFFVFVKKFFCVKFWIWKYKHATVRLTTRSTEAMHFLGMGRDTFID